MGISANQARLMTLTARQHDLELRAQQISAHKMIKSLNSQRWAMEYSSKLNIFNLQKQQSTQVGYFKEIPTPITQEWLDEKGYVALFANRLTGVFSGTNPTASSFENNLNRGYTNIYKYIRLPEDSKVPQLRDLPRYAFLHKDSNPNIFSSIEAAYLQNAQISREELVDSLAEKGFTYGAVVAYQLYYESPKEDGTCASVKVWLPAYSTDPSTAIEIDPAIIEDIASVSSSSTERYMHVLVTDRPEPTYEYVPYDGFLDIDVVKAEYDAAVSSLTSDEKLLDMELTQINTEHKAVKTEYDSVKGLVGENVDKSFNVFG